MRRMVEKIIAQYGTDMRLTSGTETKTVRAFFRAVNAKSWQSMESEATLLGEISRGQYAYIGPVGAQVREGDTLTLGDKTYLFRRAELYYYRNQPVYSIFPMDKIPETQALFLEDFKWEGHRRPALREVFARTIRPSERAEKSALPRPDFPITRRIEEYKKMLIESGTWVDRDDKLTPEALEWLHWLGY